MAGPKVSIIKRFHSSAATYRYFFFLFIIILHTIWQGYTNSRMLIRECSLHEVLVSQYSTELHGHFHTAQGFQSMFKYLNVHKM